MNSATAWASRAQSSNSADGELRTKIEQAFETSGHANLRNVRPVVQHGQVILQGQVPTYYAKQLAQVVALNTPNIKSLVNELVVTPECLPGTTKSKSAC
jgi:osmotically-inducible protein OsmY